MQLGIFIRGRSSVRSYFFFQTKKIQGWTITNDLKQKQQQQQQMSDDELLAASTLLSASKVNMSAAPLFLPLSGDHFKFYNQSQLLFSSY